MLALEPIRAAVVAPARLPWFHSIGPPPAPNLSAGGFHVRRIAALHWRRVLR
jgi:hypothetical protein